MVVNGFEPGQCYEFVVRARVDVPGLSPAELQEVARSPPLQWAHRMNDEWSMDVDWGLPAPVQLPVPQESEDHSTRWLTMQYICTASVGTPGSFRV